MKSKMKEEIESALKWAFGVGIIFGICIALIQSCGKASADNGVRAVEIPSPVNTNCYAILNSAGDAVGGNCLWQR